MSRNKLSESLIIIATSEVQQFASGDTVVISIYKNGSGTPEPVSSSSCTQIGATGIFWWPFMNLDNVPTAFADYKWVMTDSGSKFSSGNERFGGYIENIASIQGSNSVTITVEEVSTIAIPDVEIQILNSIQTIVLDNKRSDVNGQAVFALDDGSYKVRLAKPQVSFATLPEDLTVSGTTVDTYNGEPLTITPAIGAGECIVSIFSSAQDPGAFLTSLAGTATIKQLPTLISGEYFPNSKIAGTYDNLTGRLSWTLPRGSVIFFKVDVLGIGKEKTIPDSASANYEDL